MDVVRKALKWAGILAFAGYAGACLLLFGAQRMLEYQQVVGHVTPAVAGLPQAEEVVLHTADGERLIAWYVAPKGQKPLNVYFHGNADSLAWRAERDRNVVADGTGLLAVSYRGYEGSTGSPTEAGLHLDADAAYAFAAARVPPERIVVWGHSLGTGVAVRLAAERPVGSLVLEAPYTSIADVAALQYPFMPVRLLLKDQFRSDLRIGQVTAPVLVMHGERDDTIPISIGERLYDLVKAPKRFVRFPEGGHIDLDDFGAVATVREFVAGLSGDAALAHLSN